MKNNIKNTFYIITISTFILSCGGSGSSNFKSHIEGFPVKIDKDDDWGVTDRNGNLIISDEFKSKPSLPHEGIVKVYDNNPESSGYEFFKVSEKPEEIGGKYKSALNFSEGLAAVVEENKSITYINKDGEIVFTCDKSIIKAGNFINGYAIIENEESLKGFIDKEGTIKIKPEFDYVEPFYEGLAMVRTDDEENGQERGYINENGEMVINLQDNYDRADPFSEGLAKVRENGGGYGYIDDSGEEVIKCDGDIKSATNFINGHAMIKEDNEYAVIDKDGEIVVKADRENRLSWETKSYGIGILIEYNSKKDELEIKNFDGDEIKTIEDVDDIVPVFSIGKIFIKDGKSWYIINAKTGEQIDEKTEYERIGDFSAKNDYNSFPFEDVYYDKIESDFFDLDGIIAAINISSHIFKDVPTADKLLSNELKTDDEMAKYKRKSRIELPKESLYEDKITIAKTYYFTSYLTKITDGKLGFTENNNLFNTKIYISITGNKAADKKIKVIKKLAELIIELYGPKDDRKLIIEERSNRMYLTYNYGSHTKNIVTIKWDTNYEKIDEDGNYGYRTKIKIEGEPIKAFQDYEEEVEENYYDH